MRNLQRIVFWICFLASLAAFSQGPKGLQTTPPSDSSGHFVQINRIFIVGNRITRDNIILRELSLKTGDIIFSSNLQEILEKDKNKLFNTRLFNTVEIRSLELVPEKVDLLVNLTERWYTFPSPIFELSDRNFNDWWENYNHDFNRVNYGLRLYQYNMRGRNETLKATLQFGFRRVLGLTYRIPYIDKSQRHGIQIYYQFEETKNLPYRTLDHKRLFLSSRDVIQDATKTGITYSFRHSFYDIHQLSFDYNTAEISDTINIINPEYFVGGTFEQTYATISYRFTSDRRDYVSYPLKGRFIDVGFAQNGLGLSDDLNKTEVQVAYATYKEVGNKLYFSNYTNAYISTQNNQPYSTLSALGFKKQVLRGYEIYVIEGPTYFINKTTLKKRLFHRDFRINFPLEQFRHIPFSIYIKSYFDFGYVQNYPNYDLNKRLTDRPIYGGGAGFDIVSSYDVVIRLEYSINHERRAGFYLNVLKEF